MIIFRCADDARVDYDSLLDSEQRRSRFSEQLLDMELRESVRLGKMYRQLQRQINCRFSENRETAIKSNASVFFLRRDRDLQKQITCNDIQRSQVNKIAVEKF